MSDHGQQRHSGGPWALPHAVHKSDDTIARSSSDAFVFGAFVIFVLHDLSRVEFRCMNGQTILADRARRVRSQREANPTT